MKNFSERGITLIVLVVTIVILLILSVIVISQISGDGIFSSAKDTAIYASMDVVEDRVYLEVMKLKEQFMNNKEYTREVTLEDLSGKVLEKRTIEGKDYYIVDISKIDIEGKYGKNTAAEFKDVFILNYDFSICYFSKQGRLYGELVEKPKTLAGVVKTGDYVEYDPTGTNYTVDGTYSGTGSDQIINRDTTLNWRVLDIKGGQVRLISELPTSSTVTLEGADGYNNAVYILDELCKILYSGSKGVAKSLKIEDIEGQFAFDYKSWPSYGTWPHMNSTNKTYPKIWEIEIGAKIDSHNSNGTLGLSKQSELIIGTGSATNYIEPMSSYWAKRPVEIDHLTSRIYYELFFDINSSSYEPYFLSSRSVEVYSSTSEFQVRIILNKQVDSYRLFEGNGHSFSETHRIRPVVTLLPSVYVDFELSTGDHTNPDNGWILK